MKIIKIEVDVEPRKRPPPKNQITSAYSHSAREDANIKTMVKDPQSIRTTVQASELLASRTSVHSYIAECPRLGERKP